MNKGNKGSLLYYIDMIIKGILIPKNYKLAKQLIDDKFSDDQSIRFYLYGKRTKNDIQKQKTILNAPKNFLIVIHIMK